MQTFHSSIGEAMGTANKANADMAARTAVARAAEDARKAAFYPGDRVVFWADEPDLPAGTQGTVTAVYDDIGDGADVRLDDGRHFNTVVTALDLITNSSEPKE